MIRNIILIAVSFLLLAPKGYSQDDKKLSITDKDVIKNFEAQLSEAKRVVINPKSHNPVSKKLNYNYDVTIVPLDLEYPDPKIRPLAKKPDPREKYNTQWLKLGYGTLQRPILDLGYQLLLEDSYNLTLTGNYEGGTQGDSLAHRAYSILGVGLNGNYFLNDAMTLTSGVNFQRNTRALYGSKVASYIQEYGSNNQSQNSNFIDFNISANSRKSNHDHLFYKLGLNLNTTLLPHDIDSLDHNELNLIVPLDLGYTKSKDTKFGINTIVDISNASPDRYENGILYNVKPYFNTKFGRVKAQFGLEMIVHQIINGNTELLPKIELSLPLKDNKFQISAGTAQTYKRNNLRNLLTDFPYTAIDQIVNSVQVNQDIYVGFDVKLEKLKINTRLGFRSFDKRAIPFYNESRKHNIKLATGESTFLNILAKYEIKPWLNWENNLFAQSLNITEGAFLPAYNFTSKLTGLFLEKKATVSLSTTFTDSVIFNHTSITFTGNKQLDFSLDGNYYFNDKMGAFLEINNILGQEYEQWYQYPDFNRNIAGGITLRF